MWSLRLNYFLSMKKISMIVFILFCCPCCLFLFAESMGSWGKKAQCEWQSSVFAGSIVLLTLWPQARDHNEQIQWRYWEGKKLLRNIGGNGSSLTTGGIGKARVLKEVRGGDFVVRVIKKCSVKFLNDLFCMRRANYARLCCNSVALVCFSTGSF